MTAATDKDTTRRDRDALIQALVDAGATVKGKMFCCPFHDDANPSMSIYEGEGGILRVKCFGCDFNGDIFDVQAKAGGGQPQDYMPKGGATTTTPTPSAGPPSEKKPRTFKTVAAIKAAMPGNVTAYAYGSRAAAESAMLVLRADKPDGAKSFWQAHRANGEYVLTAPPKPWPLYNLDRVKVADSVVVVEGEKCVHALHDIGIVATTSPGGANNAASADWTPLAGKAVYIWPDNDENGIKYGKTVAGMLKELKPQPRVFWIEPAALNLQSKGDAADLINEFDNLMPDEIRAVVDDILKDAQPTGAAAGVHERFESIISGKWQAIPWPWPQTSKLTRALLPQTVTLICGDPGSTKSFLLLEALVYWHMQGISVAVFQMEEDREFHLTRVIAQQENDSRMLDDEWVRDNPEIVRDRLRRNASLLDEFGVRVHASPDKNITLDDMDKWVWEQAAAGARIIAVDPITAATGNTSKPWVDDLNFLLSVKRAVREYNSSLILITHPRTGSKSVAGLPFLAGGAAYARFPQTVLWLQRLDEAKMMTVRRDEITRELETNRLLNLAKCRNGMGQGLQVGFNFDQATVRLAEQGVVVKQRRKPKAAAEQEFEPPYPYGN